MKRKITSYLLSTSLLSMCVIQTSCFGEFALTRAVYEFNQGIADDSLGGRFVRNLVFIAMNIVPIYGAASTIDFVVLNLIEFWTGSNPLAMQAGEMEQQHITYQGQEYLITATQFQFKVERLADGEVVEQELMIFDVEASTWSVVSGGEKTEVIAFRGLDQNSRGIVDVFTKDGCFETVSVSASMLPRG